MNSVLLMGVDEKWQQTSRSCNLIRRYCEGHAISAVDSSNVDEICVTRCKVLVPQDVTHIYGDGEERKT